MKSIKSALSALLIVAAACFAGVAAAAPSQSWTATWTVPTKRADGTALSASEIAKYTIYYTVDAGTAQTVDVAGDGTTSKAFTTALAARATPYALRFSITATDTDGNESARSAEVAQSITVKAANPNAPSSFKLNVTCASGSCNLIIQ